MTKEETKDHAKVALDWARGSWGQGSYDKPKFDNKTMAALYTEIAIQACDMAVKYFDAADAERKNS